MSVFVDENLLVDTNFIIFHSLMESDGMVVIPILS